MFKTSKKLFLYFEPIKQIDSGEDLKKIAPVFKSILLIFSILTIKDLWHLIKLHGKFLEILLNEPYVSTMPEFKLKTVFEPDFSIKLIRF